MIKNPSIKAWLYPVSPLSRVILFPNGRSWLINGGDPNHLLNGMIFQVGDGVGWHSTTL